MKEKKTAEQLREEENKQMLKLLIVNLEVIVGEENGYLTMPVSKLNELAKQGDDDAAAYYAAACMRDNTLTDDDVLLLNEAVARQNMAAAKASELIYGTDNFGRADFNKFFYAQAVLEQWWDSEGHRLLFEVTNKGDEETQELILAIEDDVLSRCITNELTEVAVRQYKRARAVVSAVDKRTRMPDYKNAYALSLYLSDGNDANDRGEYPIEDVYLFYNRGKKTKEAAFLPQIRARLERFFYRTDKTGLFAVSSEIMGQRDILVMADGKNRQEDDALKKRIKREEFFAQKGSADGVTEVDLKVSVSTEQALNAQICPSCGAVAAVKDGTIICSVCGYSGLHKADGAAKLKNGAINLKLREQSKEALTVLNCTQCGGPVSVNEEGENAVCGACGASFLVNSNALKLSVHGLIRKDMEAAKPKDAEIPTAKFVRVPLLGGKLNTVIPEEFYEMDEKFVRIKYPTNPPEFIYTNVETTVNLCFRVQYDKNFSAEETEKAGQGILALMKKIQPLATFGKGEKLVADGKPIYFFDLITPAADQDIYNAMFIFELSGKYAMGSWNCLSKDRWFWGPVFRLAVESMTF